MHPVEWKSHLEARTINRFELQNIKQWYILVLHKNSKIEIQNGHTVFKT